MRDQLIQYVNLLFAGAKDCEDIKQEILQNTLDRYDDLIAEGKVPEAAYRLAITGIGDLSDILGAGNHSEAAPVQPVINRNTQVPSDNPAKKLGRAIAVGLYIISILPLILLSELGMDIIGLCATVSIVAVATVLMILCSKKEQEEKEPEENQSPLHRSVKSLIWTIGLAVYFLLSFMTNAWHVTWLIFPLTGAVNGLVAAILDLKEVN